MRVSFKTALIALVGAGIVVAAILIFTAPHRAADSGEGPLAASGPGGGDGWARADLPKGKDPRASQPSGGPNEGRGSLSGKVSLEPADAAVPEDLVVLLRPSRFHAGTRGTSSRELAVDAARRFKTEGLALGAYEARVHGGTFEGLPLELQLTESVPHIDVALRAFKRPDLLGFVRDEGRAPVEKVRVAIQGTAERGARVAMETTTLSDGSFRFERIEDGNYEVSVGYPNLPLRVPLRFEVRDGVTPKLLLDVPRLSGIDATVVVTGILIPVEGFHVTCVRLDSPGAGEVESVATDAEGRVAFHNLPPGRYALRGFREFFKRVNGAATLQPARIEKVQLEAYPLDEDLLRSLEWMANPEKR
jgi:carboxypeptidase family protein